MGAALSKYDATSVSTIAIGRALLMFVPSTLLLAEWLVALP
jgi:hypothetical protein